MNKIIICLVCLIGSSVWAESLFESGTYRSVVEDRRAAVIGDSLTVIIVESSQATSNNGTSVDNVLSISGGLSETGKTRDVALALNAAKSGEGQTQREGSLRAQITVIVTGIDSQGYLYLTGKQVIVVNGEEQVIKISGKVRSEDITKENTILSTRIADSKIEYSGEGIAKNSEKKGMVLWIMTKLRLI